MDYLAAGLGMVFDLVVVRVVLGLVAVRMLLLPSLILAFSSYYGNNYKEVGGYVSKLCVEFGWKSTNHSQRDGVACSNQPLLVCKPQ